MANLGHTLLLRKDINLIQLNLALDFRVFYGGKLGTNLLELGIIDEETLGRALSQSLAMPVARREDLEKISREVINLIPREVAYRAKAVPFRLVGSQLFVSFAEPKEAMALREVKQITKLQVLAHVSPEVRIYGALEEYYQLRMEPRMKSLLEKLESKAKVRKGLRSDREPPQEKWQQSEDPAVSSPKPAESAKVSLSVQKITLMLEEAKSRDAIAQLLLQFSQKYLQRIALFVLRKDMGFGWDGLGKGIDRQVIKSIMFPLQEPSIFQTLVASQGHFLGKSPDSPVNNQFFKALGGIIPQNVLLLPLTIGGITFGALYGDNCEEGVQGDGINELQVVVSRANIAFERLIIAEREKALKVHASI